MPLTPKTTALRSQSRAIMYGSVPWKHTDSECKMLNSTCLSSDAHELRGQIDDCRLQVLGVVARGARLYSPDLTALVACR